MSKENLKSKYNALFNLVERLKEKKAEAEPKKEKPVMPPNLTPVEQEAWQKQVDQEAYQWLVQQHQPKTTWFRNLLLAFLVGGIICSLGQLMQNYIGGFGFTLKEAGTITVFIMVFLGAFLTGLGIYDKIGKYGGAGSIIPITGFANSIVASAMEFKREGYIYGVGARLFTVAGPVLTFGFIVSVLVGLLVYILA